LRGDRFDVSLRVDHPTLLADEICAGLGLTPSRTWNAGDP